MLVAIKFAISHDLLTQHQLFCSKSSQQTHIQIAQLFFKKMANKNKYDKETSKDSAQYLLQ